MHKNLSTYVGKNPGTYIFVKNVQKYSPTEILLLLLLIGGKLDEKFQSFIGYIRRMSPKDMLVLAVIYFVLVHSGETFTRPRPQALEFSKAFGFISALKAMFGLDREKNEIYEKLEPLRKKMSCARLARDLNKRWIEWYCLKGMPNKKPSNYPNWNFGF